ncbi:hypothetical protein ACXC9Q_38720 (plasmid) [Kribbella sp. CWNU-51]
MGIFSSVGRFAWDLLEDFGNQSRAQGLIRRVVVLPTYESMVSIFFEELSYHRKESYVEAVPDVLDSEIRAMYIIADPHMAEVAEYTGDAEKALPWLETTGLEPSEVLARLRFLKNCMQT